MSDEIQPDELQKRRDLLHPRSWLSVHGHEQLHTWTAIALAVQAVAILLLAVDMLLIAIDR